LRLLILMPNRSSHRKPGSSIITRLWRSPCEQQTEREAYVVPWLPDPLINSTAPPADAAEELASDLSFAFLLILERLAPEDGRHFFA